MYKDRKKHNEVVIKRKRRLQEAGLCVQCGKQANGTTRCAACYADKRECENRLKEERKILGLCIKCGNNKAEENILSCNRCKEHNKNKRKSFLKSNPQRAEEIKTKERVKSVSRRNRLKSEGLCVYCGRNKQEIGLSCTKCSSKCSQRNKKRNRKLREEVLNHYGAPFCACCKQELPYEFLQLDHKNDDGADHRREIGKKTGSNMTLWARENGYPPIFQVTCANCNFARGIYGYCPCGKKNEVKETEFEPFTFVS